MDDARERGRQGEAIARQWLLNNGYIVVATSDIDSGGAPMLLSRAKKVILPDNITFRAGEKAFVEVKTYQKAAWEQDGQRWQHGILLVHYRNYCEAARECDMPCYLAVVQVDIWKLLLGELRDLSVTAHGALAPSKFGTEIYFDVNRFEWFPLDGLEKLPDIEPESKRPWDKKQFPEAPQGHFNGL